SLVLRLFRGLCLGVVLAFVVAVYGRPRKQSFCADLLHRSLLWEWCGVCLPALDALHSATFVPSHPDGHRPLRLMFTGENAAPSLTYSSSPLAPQACRCGRCPVPRERRRVGVPRIHPATH